MDSFKKEPLAINMDSVSTKSVIDQYNDMKLGAEAFVEKTNLSDTAMQSYLQTVQSGSATFAGYTKYINTSNKAIGLMGVKTKLTTTLLGGLKATLTTIGITLAINLIGYLVTAIDDYVHKSERIIETAEEARKKIDELNNSFNENKKTINDVKERYAELAQGIDQLTGKNKSLSTEDYEEFLNISNQLGEQFPDLVKKYDDSGNAILNLSGNVNQIVDAFDNLIKKEKELVNLELASSMKDVYKGYATSIDELDDSIEKEKQKQQDLIKARETLLYSPRALLSNQTTQRGDLEKALDLFGVDYKRTVEKSKDGTEAFVYDIKDLNNATEINKKYKELYNQSLLDLQVFNSQIETETNKMHKYMRSSLQLDLEDYNFGENDASLKAVIEELFTNFDISNLSSEVDSDDWDEVYAYLKRTFLYPVSLLGIDIQEKLIQAFSKPEDMSNEEYIDFVSELQTYFDDNHIGINLDFVVADEKDIESRFKNHIDDITNGNKAELGTLNTFIDENEIDSAEEKEYFLDVTMGAKTAQEAIDLYNDSIKKADTWEEVDPSSIYDGLDEIQSAYQSVSSAIDEYKEKGELSLNTVKSLVALGDEYVSTLYDENGQLALNTNSYNQLTIARLLDLQAAIAQNALKTIDTLKSEDSAKKYLTDTTLELAGAKWQEVYANIELARTELLLKNQSGQQGEDISARLQALNQLESATRNRQALVEQAIEDAKNASSNFYSVTSGSSSSETKENIFDWADNSIQNLMRDIDTLNDKLSTVSLEDKIAIYDKLDGKNKELVEASKNAMETYEKDWNKKSSKISSKYKKRIQSNDTFTLEEFGNKKTYNAVVEAQQSYQTWQDAVGSYVDALYQKEQNQSDKTSTLLEIANIELDTLSSTDTSNMLAEEKNELINKEMAKKKEILKLNLSLAKSEAERLKIQQDYDNDKKNDKTEKYENYREIRSNRISHFQAKRQDVQNEIDIAEAMGGQGTKEQYESMNNSLDREKYWETRNRDLAKAQRDQYEYGTESWAKYNSEMQDAENNIKACTIAQIENNKAIIMLPVHELEEENKQLERSLDLLNKKKEKLEQAISYPTILIEEEIETLNKDKDTITLDYDDRIEAIEDEKELYTKVNDELQRKIDLQNAEYNLEKAKRNRTTRVYRKGEGFVYEADQDAIRDAQADYDKQVYDNKVADFDKQIDELNKNKEDEIKILDKAIKKWTDYKDLLDKVSSSFDKKVAKEEFFKEFDQATLDAVMNQDTSILPTFENQLNSLKQNIKGTEDQIYNNNQSILQYQIAAEEYGKTLLAIQQMQEILNKTLLNNTDELKANEERTDSANTYGLAWSNVKVGVATALTDGTAAQVLAKKAEEDINKERLKNLETFKKGVVSIYDEISSAVLKAVNALSDLQVTYNQMKSLNSAINSIPKSSPLGLLSGIGVVSSIVGTMHSGGIVGEESKNNLPEHLIALTDANLKPNETFAKLLNGEVVLNNSQIGNMFDNLNRAYTALTPLNKRENSPTNITIGDVNVYNPDNTDMIVDEIVKELPLKVIQKLHSK